MITILAIIYFILTVIFIIYAKMLNILKFNTVLQVIKQTIAILLMGWLLSILLVIFSISTVILNIATWTFDIDL